MSDPGKEWERRLDLVKERHIHTSVNTIVLSTYIVQISHKMYNNYKDIFNLLYGYRIYNVELICITCGNSTSPKGTNRNTERVIIYLFINGYNADQDHEIGEILRCTLHM